MTLRTKFIIVLCMFGLAVCINIAAAGYYTSYQLKQAHEAYVTVSEPAGFVRQLLLTVRRQHDAMVVTLDAGFIDPPMRRRLQALTAVIDSDQARLTSGQETLAHTIDFKALERRLAELQRLINDYLERAAAEDDMVYDAESVRTQYLAQYEDLREQLTSTMLAMNAVLNRYVNTAPRTSANVLILLFTMAAAEIVAMIYTLSLFRNWMLKPIDAIRIATQEIAAGNLQYRLPENQQGEFGALAHQVNRMAAALVDAQNELKQKERLAATGEMVAVVAHNIRNPIAGIRATAQSCLHEIDPASEIGRQQQRIIEAVDSLEQWLKELLHLNRPLELRLEPTAIDELVNDLRQTFQPSIERKDLQLTYQPHHPRQHIGVDRQYFVQALASILDNAIQAAPHGSRVSISAAPANDEPPRFAIEISDTGGGIPEKIRQQIFQPYFSTKPGGTGIGLSMAKKIIEAHRGRLLITNGSDASSGATLRIEIPHPGSTAGGVVDHG